MKIQLTDSKNGPIKKWMKEDVPKLKIQLADSKKEIRELKVQLADYTSDKKVKEGVHELKKEPVYFHSERPSTDHGIHIESGMPK